MKTIIKIWKNKWLILEGLWNRVFKTDTVEKVAAERMKRCVKCENFDKTGTKCEVPGTQPCCGICGCSLALKLRSLESECPHPDGPKWRELKL